MYIIKNAMKNILRSPGRNILIGIIAVVIAISSTVALSIKQSAISAEEDALNNLVITASITVDRQKLQSQAGADRELLRELINSVENVSLEEMQIYASSSYVEDFNYTIESSVAGNDEFEAYTETEDVVQADPTTNTKIISNTQVPHNNLGGFSGIGQQGDFTIVGYNDEEGMRDFIIGQSKITEGSLFNFTEDSTCIISDTLAVYNEIGIGDTIIITNPNLDTESYTLTITGIYSSTLTSENDNLKFSSSQDPANQIYTSFSTLNSISETSLKNATTSTNSDGIFVTTALRSTVGGVYSFSDIENYENFKASLTSMGLGEYYSLNSSDVSNYETSLTPIQNLSSFADLFLVLVLVIGGIILVVLNIFNIRERKYELVF
jgi:putative ABC transport system permease protein